MPKLSCSALEPIRSPFRRHNLLSLPHDDASMTAALAGVAKVRPRCICVCPH